MAWITPGYNFFMEIGLFLGGKGASFLMTLVSVMGAYPTGTASGIYDGIICDFSDKCSIGIISKRARTSICHYSAICYACYWAEAYPSHGCVHFMRTGLESLPVAWLKTVISSLNYSSINPILKCNRRKLPDFKVICTGDPHVSL